MEQGAKQKSYEPVFIIGVTLFAVQLFWVVLTKAIPEWYKIGMITLISVCTALIAPVLCAYFVKDPKHRTILIVLIFLSVFLRMAEQYLTGLL